MTPSGGFTFDTALIWLIAGWAVLGIGALLLLWALFRDRSRGRRRCPKCWYDMTGVPGLRCPECGRDAKREQKFFKTRRRWGWALIALLLVCTGYVSTRVPRALTHGWLDAVPVVLLRPALWWERDKANKLFTDAAANSNPFSGTLSSSAFISFLPGGSLPIVAGPTQWERFLIASEAGRRIDVASPQADSFEAIGVVGDLGRESRPAHAALRRLLHASPTPTAVNIAAALTSAGSADFGTDLRRLLGRDARQEVSSAALSGLISIEVNSGRMSSAVRAAILREPYQHGHFNGWVQLVPPKGEPTAAMLDLVATMLKHQDKEARSVATTPVLYWMTEGHWSEPFAEELWNGQVNEDMLSLIAYMIGECGENTDKWGPRLLQLAEHPSAEIRSNAMSGLSRRVMSKEWTSDSLSSWLCALDRTQPPENGARRDPREWVVRNLGGSRCLEPVVVKTVAAAAGATSEEIIAILTPIMLDGDQPRIRRAAIVAIAEQRLNVDRAHAFGLQILEREPDAYVRATVFDSLVRPHLSDSRMRRMLEAGLLESNPIVLIIVAQIAGTVPDPEPRLVARLRELAESADYSVASISRGSLRNLGLETDPTVAQEPAP